MVMLRRAAGSQVDAVGRHPADVGLGVQRRESGEDAAWHGAVVRIERNDDVAG